MNFETLREQARNWRANQEACERSKGYVVIFNGQVAGWKRELDNPQGWEPGCLAVSSVGSVYQAEGGNAYDGARVWQRLDLANPTLHEDAFTTAHMAAPEKLKAVRQVLWETLPREVLVNPPSRAVLQQLMQAPDRSSLKEARLATGRCSDAEKGDESVLQGETTSHGNAPSGRTKQ